MALLIILVLSLFLNVSLIRRGGVKSAVAAACLNAVPIGMALAVVLANPGRTWTDRLSWISAGLLLDGLMAGWALRLWNLRRLLAWAACFALAGTGEYSYIKAVSACLRSGSVIGDGVCVLHSRTVISPVCSF